MEDVALMLCDTDNGFTYYTSKIQC